MTTDPDYDSITGDILAALDRAGLDPETHRSPLALTLGGPETVTAISVRALVSALVAASEGAYREDPDGEYGPTTITDALKAHPDRAVRWLGGLLAEVVTMTDDAFLATHRTDTGAEPEPTYTVYRFYSDDTPTETIATGLTLDEARAHCQDPDTAGDGWFDGYDLDE